MKSNKSVTYQFKKQHKCWRTAPLSCLNYDELSFCAHGMGDMWPKLRNAKSMKATIHYKKPPYSRRSFRMDRYSRYWVDVYVNNKIHCESLSINSANALRKITADRMFWVTTEVMT